MKSPAVENTQSKLNCIFKLKFQNRRLCYVLEILVDFFYTERMIKLKH